MDSMVLICSLGFQFTEMLFFGLDHLGVFWRLHNNEHLIIAVIEWSIVFSIWIFALLLFFEFRQALRSLFARSIFNDELKSEACRRKVCFVLCGYSTSDLLLLS